MRRILELKNIYLKIRKDIEKKRVEFRKNFNSNKKIFSELIFCILTPQSKAEVCDRALKNLMKKDLLFHANTKELLKELKEIRFRNKKTKYILEAKKFFTKNGKLVIKKILKEFKDAKDVREFLVKNIRGIGYKEASHFLRNIAFEGYKNLAILDRHVLRSLKKLKIIDSIPKSLSKNKYLEIEEKMKNLAKKLNTDLFSLDFVLWYKASGRIFK